MVKYMKVENSQAIFSLPRRMVRILLVAMLTLTSLGIPLATNAIAAPQPNLAAVKTQNRMIDKQNRALDSQNNPDGIEFGFEDEARILGVEDTLDKVKEAFGGEGDQRSLDSAKGNSTKTSNNISYGAVNNVQRTVGESRNLSDRSTIQAKQRAKRNISKVENAAEDIGDDIKNSAQKAQNKAARDTNQLQNVAEDVSSSITSTAEDVASNLKESFEAEKTTQSMAKKNKTVGLSKS